MRQHLWIKWDETLSRSHHPHFYVFLCLVSRVWYLVFGVWHLACLHLTILILGKRRIILASDPTIRFSTLYSFTFHPIFPILFDKKTRNMYSRKKIYYLCFLLPAFFSSSFKFLDAIFLPSNPVFLSNDLDSWQKSIFNFQFSTKWNAKNALKSTKTSMKKLANLPKSQKQRKKTKGEKLSIEHSELSAG